MYNSEQPIICNLATMAINSNQTRLIEHVLEGLRKDLAEYDTHSIAFNGGNRRALNDSIRALESALLTSTPEGTL